MPDANWTSWLVSKKDARFYKGIKPVVKRFDSPFLEPQKDLSTAPRLHRHTEGTMETERP